ncbi:hypothetical protein Franean1_6772 [Parafrankia sp. EAN1pec]|nr:hypothetical protein Franean1_6772 [Frankia sp. EAN1pec]
MPPGRSDTSDLRPGTSEGFACRYGHAGVAPALIIGEARAWLDRAIARGAAGDQAGVWDPLTPEDQALIARDGSVAYQQACHTDARQDTPFKIIYVCLEDLDAALAIGKGLGVSLPAHAFYRDGQWLTRLADTNRTGVTAWRATPTCHQHPGRGFCRPGGRGRGQAPLPANG